MKGGGPIGTRHYRRVRVAGTARVVEEDAVAVEEPLEIRVAGRPIAVLLRTPGHDEDLATGFALTEGIIDHAHDIDEVRPCAAAPAHAIGNVVDVVLRAGAFADFARHQSPRFSNSACGVCGMAALDNLVRHCQPLVEPAEPVELRHLTAAPELLRQMQPGFRATGGLHAAGLMDGGGRLHCVREDVGRHNATDKSLGAWALERPGEQAHAIVVSSRAGFEIVEKARMARVPVLVSVGAPTSLAIETAEAARITLVAFAGGEGCSIYTHPGRVR